MLSNILLRTLAASIDTNKSKNIDLNILKKFPYNRLGNALSLRNSSDQELVEIIGNLKTEYATCWDEIPASLLISDWSGVCDPTTQV